LEFVHLPTGLASVSESTSGMFLNALSGRVPFSPRRHRPSFTNQPHKTNTKHNYQNTLEHTYNSIAGTEPIDPGNTRRQLPQYSRSYSILLTCMNGCTGAREAGGRPGAPSKNRVTVNKALFLLHLTEVEHSNGTIIHLYLSSSPVILVQLQQSSVKS
jgi:hypothetical protein